VDEEVYRKYIDDVTNHRSSLHHARLTLQFKDDSDDIESSNLSYPREHSLEGQLRERFEVVKQPIAVCKAFLIGAGHRLLDTPFGKASQVLSPLWRKRVAKAAVMLRDFLRERGWEKRVVFYLYDEPPSEDIPKLLECAKLLRTVFPEIRLIYGGMWLDPRLQGVIREHYLGGSYAHMPAQALKDAGDRLWRRNILCSGIDARIIRMRLFLWMLWRDRFDAWQVWTAGTLGSWRPPPKGMGADDLNHAFSWVYPGEDGPVGTIRWEILREGFEDYEYLWTLRAAAKNARERGRLSAEERKAVAEAEQLLRDSVNSLVPREGRFASYNLDPGLLHELRRNIGVQIGRLSKLARRSQ